MSIKCLFLGYSKKETKLIKILENKGCEVKNLSRKIKIHDTKGFHLFISFTISTNFKQTYSTLSIGRLLYIGKDISFLYKL